MIDNSREYIICAGIWYKDGTEAPRGLIAQNIDNGVVIGQWRHGNCINIRSTNPLWNAKKLAERKQETPMISSYEDTLKYYDYVDGFLTSHGRFVDRWQGMAIAYLAGQVPYERAKCKNYEGEYVEDGNGWNMMYSEDLY